MVLDFSANSNTSNDVSRELILAANASLIIIPFKIDDIRLEPGKQYYLARTHWHIMFISGFLRETHGTLAKVLSYQGVPMELKSS